MGHLNQVKLFVYCRVMCICESPVPIAGNPRAPDVLHDELCTPPSAQ